MRNVKFDRDNPLDLHEQVAAEIRRAIADGEAKPGERHECERTSEHKSRSRSSNQRMVSH
jgi:DNA-binding GntR family transcriptional regulator